MGLESSSKSEDLLGLESGSNSEALSEWEDVATSDSLSNSKNDASEELPSLFAEPDGELPADLDQAAPEKALSDKEFPVLFDEPNGDLPSALDQTAYQKALADIENVLAKQEKVALKPEEKVALKPEEKIILKPERPLESPTLQLPKMAKEENLDLPFGKACILMHFATQEQVNDALVLQTETPEKKLGDIMLEQGMLTAEQVNLVLSSQKSKTLFCKRCDKKYQIVLYQKSRIYKCKICAEVLKPWEEKKKPGAQPSEKLELMGLTQEIAIQPSTRGSRKIDTAGIDFAPNAAEVKEAPKSILTTEDVLKKSGVAVQPRPHRDYRKSIIPPKKTNYTKIILGLCALVATIWVGSQIYNAIAKVAHKVTSVEVKPIVKKAQENKAVETSENTEELKKKKMQQTFERISKAAYDGNNLASVKLHLGDYQKFLEDYPNAPQREWIAEEMNHLYTLVSKAAAKEEAEQFTKLWQKHLAEKNFLAAEKLLWEYRSRGLDAEQRRDLQDSEKRFLQLSQESMQKTLADALSFVKAKKFPEAISLLKKEESIQTTSCATVLHQKIAEIENQQKRTLWQEHSFAVAQKLYPLLVERKYQQALAILPQEMKPEFKAQFEEWESDIRKALYFWESLQQTLKSHKDQEIEIQPVGQASKKAKLSQFSAKTEVMILTSEKNVTNIKLGRLSNETLRHFLAADLNSPEKIAQFSLFLLPFKDKDSQSVKASFPELAQFPNKKALFISYLLASVLYHIGQKNWACFEEVMNDLQKNYASVGLLQTLRPTFSQKLWDQALELEKAGKKKAAKEILNLILLYFEDTPRGKDAKEK